MQTLFDGEVTTDYSQIHVVTRPETEGDLNTAFAGQVNGLCGGASPGFLYLVTGLYYGRVGFTVELHDDAPPVDDDWEEVVEVSFAPSSEAFDVVELFGGAACSLTVPLVQLRVRYCAHGMDEAAPVRSVFDKDPILDRYLLQLWPAPPAGDRVLKQTSACAAHHHAHAGHPSNLVFEVCQDEQPSTPGCRRTGPRNAAARTRKPTVGPSVR